MILEPIELQTLYDAIVKSSGHIDPMGFMARILLTSGGDPDYVDVKGFMGLMPLKPDIANEFVGSTDSTSLEGNIITALAMDMKLYETFKSLEKMVIKFHDGVGASVPSVETREILDSLDEARVETRNLLFPRRATVQDVIDLLNDPKNDMRSGDEVSFFKRLSGIS